LMNSRRFIAPPEAQNNGIVAFQITRVKGRRDVRLGSLADISQCNRDVRFTPESGHVQCTRHVRFGPKADIAPFTRSHRRRRLVGPAEW
jgi:hypothetical protein